MLIHERAKINLRCDKVITLFKQHTQLLTQGATEQLLKILHADEGTIPWTVDPGHATAVCDNVCQ